MKRFPTTQNPPARRDLVDARSSRPSLLATPRKALLNDRRSTR